MPFGWIVQYQITKKMVFPQQIMSRIQMLWQMLYFRMPSQYDKNIFIQKIFKLCERNLFDSQIWGIIWIDITHLVPWKILFSIAFCIYNYVMKMMQLV